MCVWPATWGNCMVGSKCPNWIYFCRSFNPWWFPAPGLYTTDKRRPTAWENKLLSLQRQTHQHLLNHPTYKLNGLWSIYVSRRLTQELLNRFPGNLDGGVGLGPRTDLINFWCGSGLRDGSRCFLTFFDGVRFLTFWLISLGIMHWSWAVRGGLKQGYWVWYWIWIDRLLGLGWGMLCNESVPL